MVNIAIFASGTGSNFEAIVAAIESKMLNANIQLLVCDQKNATVIAKAQAKGIPTFVFSASDYADKAAYEQAILKALTEKQVKWLILAGYMRLLGKTLLNAFVHKIVNIHPSLLPNYKGKNAIERAFEAKEKEIGISIHYVDEGMDTGELIAQESILLEGNESLDEVTTKIHHLEQRLYSQTLAQLFNERR